MSAAGQQDNALREDMSTAASSTAQAEPSRGYSQHSEGMQDEQQQDEQEERQDLLEEEDEEQEEDSQQYFVPGVRVRIAFRS